MPSPALVLPAVLIMRDGSTRILAARHRDPKKAKVVDPSAKPPATPQPFGAAAADYLGYAFLARPMPAADARTVAAGDLPRLVRHGCRRARLCFAVTHR